MDLATIALKAGQQEESTREAVDIIEFIESSWGLNIPLFPVQRVIIKAHYGIALDDNPWGLDLSKPVPLDHPEYDKIAFVPDEGATLPLGADGVTPIQNDAGYYRYRVTISDWRGGNIRHMSEAGYLEMLYSEGRSNIKEVVPGVQRRELVLSIGRRSGKCVLGDTLVLTDRGVRRIEELGDVDGPEVQPLDIGVAQEGSRKTRSAYFYNGGVRSTREVTTRCGYRICGTDNHRIKVLGSDGEVDWKYIADFQVGDMVCIHRNTNLWASAYVDCTPFHKGPGYPDSLTEEWGDLLGYTGAGGLDHYKHRTPAASGFSSAGVKSFLHDLGLQLDLNHDAKVVPWAILQSPRPVVQAFLRGVFDASGGVKSGGQVVFLSLAHGQFAREVQTLLLNLGIVSHIKLDTTQSRMPWTLTIHGDRSRGIFGDLVGLGSGKEGGDDAESIPHQRWWLLGLIPKPSSEQDRDDPDLRDVLGDIIKSSVGGQIGYQQLAEILPVAHRLGADPDVLAHFEHLMESDYFFDPVVSIEEGVNPVFDLNVPDGESFVANGMTNHNTFLCACVMAYEVYKLILKDNPQGYYGIPKTNVIQLISVATDKDQAGLLYNEASGHFSQCGFYKPYTANNTMSYAKFQSPEDIRRFGRYVDDPTAKATIKVSFKSCIAKGLRGAGNIVIILDELAHFNDVGQSDALKIYRAVKPSLAAFSPKHPKNKRVVIGGVEGRILSISSPLGKQGFFYRKFRQGFAGGLESQNMLCIQAPTWEVNPTIEAAFLAEEYITDPDSFFTEYGAEFTDRTRGWLKPEDLLACVNPALRQAMKAPVRAPHFMGIDVSAGLLDGNYCAVAIGHVDEDGSILLDYIERIRAGEGDFKSLERLSFDEITNWLYALSRRFYISSGLFDQWAGVPFEAALHNKGLTQCESVFFTKQLTSQVFANFKTLMFEKNLQLYDSPKIAEVAGDTELHAPYIAELLELQAEVHSKYIITVEAPDTPGKFDDYSDALVRMVWQATQHMGKRKYIAGTTTRGHKGPTPTSMAKIMGKARRMAKLGGSSPDRQASTINRKRVRGRGGR